MYDIYKMNNNFDIVIPVGPRDIDIINKQIHYTKQNIIGYRYIYIITSNKSLKLDKCITISEDIFPFKDIVKTYINNNKFGWYFQQLIKLYAGLIIPNILDKYLVLDADTFFLKKTYFISDNKCLYNYGVEYHKPYFDHMIKLDNSFKKKFKYKSGICHHMMFETKYIKKLFNIVESNNKDKFYISFLKNIENIYGSGASEYELYFNFMVTFHFDKIIIRKLHWDNVSYISDEIFKKYDYISYHWYNRK